MIYKIDFCDFWSGFDKENNYIINTLRNIYGKENVIISKSPDYLFFSCFGFKNLRYDCVKIFFAGENIVPDFNLCDYAIGANEISFENRYFRLPLFMLYPEKCKNAIYRNNKENYADRKFCCYVISNALGAPERMKIIDLLSSYKKIDSGGKLNNNVGGPIRDKLKFISDYKFNLCFENSSTVGYTTEKIVESFASGSVPIYWGNPAIANDFNPNAFINCHDFDDFEQVIEFVKHLDTDVKAYLDMVHSPIFAKGQDDFDMIQNKMEDFLKYIFEKGVKKINNTYVGRKYMCRMKFFYPYFCVYRIGERVWGYYKNLKRIKRISNDHSSNGMS